MERRKFAKIAGAGPFPFDAPGSSQNILRRPTLDATRMYCTERTLRHGVGGHRAPS